MSIEFALAPYALREAAADLAATLESRGLRAGERVAIYCGNSPEFVLAREAVTALKLVAVPINDKLAPPEIGHIIADSEARAVLVGDRYQVGLARSNAHTQGADFQTIRVPKVPLIRDEAWSRSDRAPTVDNIGATLLYTSGTTGVPKGCLRTAEQETARALELTETYGLHANDVQIIAGPLAHSAPGIFLRAGRAVASTTVVLRRFDPRGFLTAVAQHRATFFFLVPTQYERLLNLDRRIIEAADVSSVRAAVVAGAPISTETKQRIIDWLGPILWEFYGSTETGTVAVLRPEEQLTKVGAVGKPPAGVEVALYDEDGQPTADGEVGEIFVSSPAVMGEYISGGDPAQRHGAFVSVGDLGRFDEDGYLYLVDRKFDTIISGGVNVYPAEVERALSKHRRIRGSVVFGVDDDDWGQIVAAMIAFQPGHHIPPETVRDWLRAHLAGFKLPRAIAVVAEQDLPLGASGKPLRRKARAIALQQGLLERLA